MKIELTISRQTKDVCSNNCPKASQYECGITYRQM